MYHRQLNRLSGLGIAPAVMAAASFGVDKLLGIFGGGAEAAALRKTISDEFWAVLRALRGYIDDPSTPGFIKPKALHVEEVFAARGNRPGVRISQFDLDSLKHVINVEMAGELKRGVATIYARFAKSGVDEIYRAVDYPPVAVAPVVTPAVPVAPIAPAVTGQVQPLTYTAQTLPAPVRAGGGLPGLDMFGQKLFGIPMPIALGAAGLVLYMLTKK
jgi:hypothetical protein